MAKDFSIALPPGTRLDDGSVELTDVLGIGGFGITYKAIDHEKNMDIVVKEYFPSSLKTVRREGNQVVVNQEELEQFERFRRTFHREARVINRFENYPNIVRVFFAIEKENGTSYYAMEHLHGETLGSFIKKSGRMDSVKAYKLLEPIMSVLRIIHREGVFHRDISPENIFLDTVNGTIVPKLIDFGAAYVALNNYTHTLPPVGKRGFSPPEQNMGIDKQGAWTDVYAFCATYYVAVTGQTPPASADILQGNARLKRPGEIDGVIMPDKAQTVLMEGLNTNRKQRIQSIDEFAVRMAEALNIEAESELESESITVYLPSHIGKIIEDSSIQKRVPSKFSACVLDNMIAIALPIIIICINLSEGFWKYDDMYLYVIAILGGLVFNIFCNLIQLGSQGKTLGIKLGHSELAGANGALISDSQRMQYGVVHSLGLISILEEVIAKVSGNEPLAYSLSQLELVNDGTRIQPSVVETPVSIMDAQFCFVNGNMSGNMHSLMRDNLIGREKGMVDILITGDDRVSRIHCEVYQRGESWFIVDKDSSNGTYVNGNRLNARKAVQLQSGDRIRIGAQEILFKN